ncbi:MAG: acetolactate synthase large subunit, partial [Draconibacterium sp.]|nr:acetolactate synthase large subunit [Draconibacterium sp.]
MENKKIPGSEAVILSLIEENVDIIFGYPGGAMIPIYDSLYDYNDKIRHILTRHEQGLVHAADGYARVTGKPGVCFATSGPGATNLVTGIANAMLDSIPMVCFTGQVGSPLLGTDAFQESDLIGITMPITKWSYQITKAEEVPEAVAKAFYIAQTGRPGPVLIDITKDAQMGMLDWKYEKCTKIRSYVPEAPVDILKIEEAANIIDKAKKPLLLLGQGVIIGRAENELREFIEKTGVPAAWTLLG